MSSSSSFSPSLLPYLSSSLLLFALLTSIITFILRRPKSGSIALPLHAHAADSNPSNDQDLPDPFDLYDPSIFEDGTSPDGGHSFWKTVKLVKIPLLLLLVSLLGTKLLPSILPLLDGEERASLELSSSLVAVILYTYLLALGISYLPMDTQPKHWGMTIHIASLLGTTTLVRSLELLSLAGRKKEESRAEGEGGVESWLPFGELGIATLATIIVISIPRGPALYFPMDKLYTTKIAADAQASDLKIGRRPNVSPEVTSCIVGQLMFSYATPVIKLGYTAKTLNIEDLPVVPHHLRSMLLFRNMRKIYGKTQKSNSIKRGSGWTVLRKVFVANSGMFIAQLILAIIAAASFYAPAYVLQKLIAYIEEDPDRRDPTWGWIYCVALFVVSAASYILSGMLWSVSTNNLQSRIKIQLNTLLFQKTLVRKDVAGGAPSATSTEAGVAVVVPEKKKDGEDDEDVTSKSQVMTLMTVDVDRVADFSFHSFFLIDAPMEVLVGSIFLYQLMGVSALYGLAATFLFVPLNQIASKIVVAAQDNLMKARDERTALMNETLQGIRMLKFMAWGRSFEARIMAIRRKELSWQRRNYIVEVAFTAIWSCTPVVVTLIAFIHFAWWRGMDLTPSIAFTSVAVLTELRFALNALPETVMSVLKGFVSLKRIELYLSTAEVDPVAVSETQKIFLNSATITWARDRAPVNDSITPSTPSSTPKSSFILQDLTLAMPENELTLICGRLGSGKTLLLLALLGEADVLAGQLVCPRSAPDAMAQLRQKEEIADEDWVVKQITAYVPQSAWLQNDSIKNNILFGLPLNQSRYENTLAACSLTSDLETLEDGDETEIGEKGLNLSGGQKARVSLARAVYSRASILLLDDVLSAVDAHTAHHLYNDCIKGPLLANRTVVLVSHHLQLTAPGAAYIVALDNGRLEYAGDRDGFFASGIVKDLALEDPDAKQPSLTSPSSDEPTIEEAAAANAESESSSVTVKPSSSSSSSSADGKPISGSVVVRKTPRKLVEDEKRGTGSISKDVWMMYFKANGGWRFWTIFLASFGLAMLSPLLQNVWLKIWSSSYSEVPPAHSPLYYIGVYSLITVAGVMIGAQRYAVLYYGSLAASDKVHKKMLETVLFASIRFHDTTNRGRLLNRFGKDLEGVDSSLADNFGLTVILGLNIMVTFLSIAAVGGIPFLAVSLVLGLIYYQVGKVYRRASRDMRRLDSVTLSPLYSLYGETIAGVSVVRAFGASANTLRSMMKCVDSNLVAFYHTWGLARWLSARFNLLSSAVLAATGVFVLVSPSVSASTAGFALAFANTVSGDLLFMVRRFVALEQSLVALERIKEYSELELEAPELIEPRPPAAWPQEGKVEVKDLVIRYAPELPNVLHQVSFDILPGEKVGIVGPTGCGKSTLALSFFRFVEATSGSIKIDGLDISSIGLIDLRSRLTIIPQDPTILSGTLRSTLDVFNEFEDAEIFESLRRVHLIPPETGVAAPIDADGDEVNKNVFRSLESVVSENGDNFSQGEKQLICMARAILRRNKVLLMDEATASIDSETDALINKTIREEFNSSTIMTIAHRLRTVIDFDRILVMNGGSRVEYASPYELLQNSESAFYLLCKATGKLEFANLVKLATEKEKSREKKSAALV